MRLTAMLVGAIAAAVVAAGCGSSNSDALTKAEYVKQAEAICKKSIKGTRAEYLAILKENEKKNSKGTNKAAQKKAEEDVGDVLLAYYQSKAEELGQLQPPEADAAQLEAMIVALEDTVAEAEKDPKVLVAGSKSITKERKIADEYGLKECSEV
jgi:hypothetical protein